MRQYEANKYAVVKYTCAYDASGKIDETMAKERYDSNCYNACWKLIEYTQGKNESNTKMKFLMPVFVEYERLTEESVEPRMMQVKVFVSLPKEFQTAEAPKPLDSEVYLETVPQFKCYVT